MFSKSDLSIEKCVLVIVKNCKHSGLQLAVLYPVKSASKSLVVVVLYIVLDLR